MKNKIYIGFAIVLFLLCVGILLTKHILAQDKTQQAFDVACVASDTTSWRNCIQQVKDQKTDFVKITSMISCASKDDCAVDLSGVKRAVIIYGVSATDTGFTRTNDFSYSLVVINDGAHINLGGFVVDDSEQDRCPDGTICPPLISITNAEKILIESLNTKSTKNSAISIQNGKSITISKSTFTDSLLHAVEVKQSSDVKMQNNTFQNSGSNAVIFSSLGNNNISYNTFTHNQRHGSFENCGTVCTGAQLVIQPGTNTVNIDHNTIESGYVDVLGAFGLTTSGIEISGSDVNTVTLQCNTIQNQTGDGIVIPTRTTSLKELIMKRNSIFNNGINVNISQRTQDTIENNCFDQSCKINGC